MNRFISFSLLRAVFVLQKGGQIDVLLLGLILTQPFLPIPGVPLGFTLDINEGNICYDCLLFIRTLKSIIPGLEVLQSPMEACLKRA